MKRMDFKTLGFAILMTIEGYDEHRDLTFFSDEFEGRPFYVSPIFDELLAETGRSLWKLRFKIKQEEPVVRLLHLVTNWQEGLRKAPQKKRALKKAAPKIAA